MGTCPIAWAHVERLARTSANLSLAPGAFGTRMSLGHHELTQSFPGFLSYPIGISEMDQLINLRRRLEFCQAPASSS